MRIQLVVAGQVSGYKIALEFNEKDKVSVVNIIDTMLTKQKFQTFFNQNINC